MLIISEVFAVESHIAKPMLARIRCNRVFQFLILCCDSLGIGFDKDSVPPFLISCEGNLKIIVMTYHVRKEAQTARSVSIGTE